MSPVMDDHGGIVRRPQLWGPYRPRNPRPKVFRIGTVLEQNKIEKRGCLFVVMNGLGKNPKSSSPLTEPETGVGPPTPT